MPTILIRQGRNPYEVMASMGIIFLAVRAVLTQSTSSVTIQHALEVWQHAVWLGLAALGAVVTLAGLYWRGNPVFGLKVERAGQVMVSAVVFIYALVMWDASTFERSGLVITLGLVIAGGAMMRVGSITLGLRGISARAAQIARE